MREPRIIAALIRKGIDAGVFDSNAIICTLGDRIDFTAAPGFLVWPFRYPETRVEFVGDIVHK